MRWCDADDFIRILSVYKMPCAFEELVPYLRDPTFRLKYDEVLRSIDFVKKYSDEMAVIRVVIKGQWPVSDREFITFIVATQLDEHVDESDQTFCSISYDCVDLEVPKNKANVRGELEMSASILRRLGPNECEFVLAVSSDPKIKGVPNSIIRAKSKQTATTPVMFYETYKKEKKSSKK